MKTRKNTKKTAQMVDKAPAQSEQPSAPAPALCPTCREFVGRGYPHCTFCREVVEQPIKAIWQTLLQTQKIVPGTPAEQELVATVLERSTEYWWSEVEAAMRLTTCATCGGPLGYGSPECADCWWSSDMLWGRDTEIAPDGTLTRNEHAMRVILRGLGQEKRHSQASLEGWHLFIPFLLPLDRRQPGSTREDINYAHTISAWIKAGRGHELAHCHSIEEMYAITRQGRR